MLLRFFQFFWCVEFVVDVVVLLNLWWSVVGFLLGWWWLVEYMVGLCWVCGGFFFLFFVLRCTKYCKIFGKETIFPEIIYIWKHFTLGIFYNETEPLIKGKYILPTCSLTHLQVTYTWFKNWHFIYCGFFRLFLLPFSHMTLKTKTKSYQNKQKPNLLTHSLILSRYLLTSPKQI